MVELKQSRLSVVIAVVERSLPGERSNWVG